MDGTDVVTRLTVGPRLSPCPVMLRLFLRSASFIAFLPGAWGRVMSLVLQCTAPTSHFRGAARRCEPGGPPSLPSTPSRGFDRRSARVNFASDFEQCAVYRNLFLFDEYSFIVRIQASRRSVSCPPLVALVRRRAHSRLAVLECR